MKFERHRNDPDTSQGHYRLSVYFDDEDGMTLVEICDEKMTSGAPTAQVIKDRSLRFPLRRSDLPWLHAQLGALLKALDVEPERTTEYVDVRAEMPRAIERLVNAAEDYAGYDDVPRHVSDELDNALACARRLLETWKAVTS